MRVPSKLLGLVLLICFFSSCEHPEHQSPLYVKLADEITSKTADKLQKEKGLVLVGIGGQMMHDIQMMAMSFYLYQEISLETARELIILSVNNYLSDINNNKEIRPYLHDHPFSSNNIEIRLFIYNPDGSNLAPEKLYYVSALNGKISYFSRMPNPSKALCEETFEEAESKVNSSP
jgi:hypothetical protein